MEIDFIQTEELVKTIAANADKWIEARLSSGYFSSTHFFLFRKNILFDEGMDGEEVQSTFTELLNRYPDNYWHIDNIV